MRRYTVMKIYHLLTALLLSGLVFVVSCDVINPEETIPAYIRIDSVGFTTATGQGAPTANIPDVWVFVNDAPLGGYELPAIIPVLAKGNADIIVAGGIKKNGFSTVRLRHPLWATYNNEITLTPAETLKVNPVVTYLADVGFEVEDFELGTGFNATGLSEVGIDLTTNPGDVLSGARALEVILTEGEDFFEFQTPAYGIGENENVFLELDYKCNQPFDVWLRANNSPNFLSSYIVTLAPQEGWNKIYIALSEVMGSITQSGAAASTTYQVEFKAVKDEDVTQGEIYIDNVKVNYL